MSDQRHWECDWCGKRSPWTDEWRVEGQRSRLGDYLYWVACSEECDAQLAAHPQRKDFISRNMPEVYCVYVKPWPKGLSAVSRDAARIARKEAKI
jgi:hypothetical protein